MLKMSARDKDCMLWMRNKDWYYIDDERDRFILTEKAPEEARRSFEKWQYINSEEYRKSGKGR